MHLFVVALLLVVSVAGCSDASPTVVESDSPEVPDASMAGRESAQVPGSVEAMPMNGHFEQSYDLLAQDVAANGQHLTASQESDNCVLLDDPAHIASGTATVAWDSSTATTMDLILWVDDAHKSFVSGGSPLTLDLSGFDVGVDRASMLSWQVAQDAPVGAAVFADGSLQLSFDYELLDEGDRMAPDEGWTCVAER
jgi:hypothetical protein